MALTWPAIAGTEKHEADLTPGATIYWPVMNSVFSYSTIEARAQIRVPVAYTINKLRVRVVTNDFTGATTILLRVNGVNTLLSVSITGGGTGLFVNDIDEVVTAADDLIVTQAVLGSGGASASKIASVSYTITAATNSWIAAKTRVFDLTVGSTISQGTFYGSFIGSTDNVTVTSEGRTQFELLADTTFSKLRVYVYQNTRNADISYTLRKNGVSTALKVTITANTTGQFVDNVNSVDCVAGDKINFQSINPVTTGTIRHSIVQLAAVGATWTIGMGLSNQFDGVDITGFGPIVDGTLDNNPFITEANAEVKLGSAYTFKRLSVVPTFIDTGGSFRLTLRKGQLDTDLTLLMTSGDNVQHTSVIDVDTIADDFVAFKYVLVEGGTEIDWQYIYLDGNIAGGGGATRRRVGYGGFHAMRM